MKCQVKRQVKRRYSQSALEKLTRIGREMGEKNVGSAHPLAKLNEDDVSTIRQLLAQGTFQRDIAEMFGVSVSTISHIKTGTIWRHVK